MPVRPPRRHLRRWIIALPLPHDTYGATDRGRTRSQNEDQFLVAQLGRSLEVAQTSVVWQDSPSLHGGLRGQLLIVADGVGGSLGGEAASSIASQLVTEHVATAAPWFFGSAAKDESGDPSARMLEDAMRRAHQAVLQAGRENPRHEGMATTLTLACVVWPRLYVGHVGDSRCYLHREGRLHRLTQDHTLEHYLQERGVQMSDGRKRQSRDIVVNVMGGEMGGVEPVVRVEALRAGDSLLLCSDGLTKHVPDQELAEQLGSRLSAYATVGALIRLANERGGSDNITVIVSRFVG